MDEIVYMFALQRRNPDNNEYKSIGHYEAGPGFGFVHLRELACRLAREMAVELRILKVQMNVLSFETSNLERICATIDKNGCIKYSNQ